MNTFAVWIIYWLILIKIFLPDSENNKVDENIDLEIQDKNEEVREEITINTSLEKAIETYRKIREQKGELTDKELSKLETECDEIRQREIIDTDIEHKVMELDGEGKILMGPPTLTRFEKARIMGARALQLSWGAPTFIEIPENATTSLDIAMEELEQRVIPISVRRTLPNGDYQNIPLFEFSNES